MKLIIAIIMTSMLLATAALGTAQAAEKHLFYMHGCCIKGKDDPKVKAYETIVQNLNEAGFKVAFDLRTADFGDNDSAVQAHAAKVADQVRTLLAQGVAPGDITVAGYSLGSMTALVTAGLIANPKVNVVLLAGCPINPAIKVSIDYAKIKGRVLSIYDVKDEKFGSCNGRLPEGVTSKEVVLNSGKGHSVFRLPDEKHMKLWKDPMLAWIKEK
jgi:hypothetical protein